MIAKSAAVRLKSKRFEQLLELFARITGRDGRRSSGLDRILLGVGAVIFVVATAIAWLRLPERPQELHAWWVAAAGALALSAMCVNAAEFWISAAILGQRVMPAEAIRVSVLGTAANILPIPGAVLIRTRALRQLGQRTGDALVVTGAVGIAWVGAAAFLAGALLVLVRHSLTFGVAFLVTSLGATALVLGLLRLTGSTLQAARLLLIAGIELLSVAFSGVRLYAVAQAIGFDVAFVDAITVNFGGILSNVAGVFPAGIGLREITSGIFASFVGVAPSIGIIMSVADRIVVYLMLSLAIVVLFARERRHGRGETIGDGR